MDGMDCQGLMEYLLRELGIKKNWKGSNAMWRSMAWRGTPEECRAVFGEIPIGAWLFIVTYDGGEEARGYHDNLGNASHVGVYTAQGAGAVHASASKGCVCESKFKGSTIKNGGWNAVGLCPLLDYATKGEPTMDSLATVVLPDGASGTTVNMRRKPAMDGAIVARVPVGASVIVNAERSGEWSRIQYGADTGWMKLMYLEEATGSQEQIPDEVSAPIPGEVTIKLPIDIARCIYDALADAGVGG